MEPESYIWFYMQFVSIYDKISFTTEKYTQESGQLQFANTLIYTLMERQWYKTKNTQEDFSISKFK